MELLEKEELIKSSIPLIIPQKENDQIMVTVIRSNMNKLGKEYDILGHKKANGNLSSGVYNVYYFKNLLALEDFLKTLTLWDVVVLGVPKYMYGNVSTIKSISSGKIGTNIIARSSKDIQYINDIYSFVDYPNYYSLIAFDYDVQDCFTNEKFLFGSQDELRNFLIMLLPFLEVVGMLIRPSSSANIVADLTDTRLKPYNGYHIYITGANSTKANVEKLVEYFKRSSWVKGYGMIVENGAGITDRYAFDMSVNKAERMWFETPAELICNHSRIEEDAQYFEGGILNLDAINYDHLPDYRVIMDAQKQALRNEHAVENTSSTNSKIKSISNIDINQPITGKIIVNNDVYTSIINVQKYLQQSIKPDVKEFHKLLSQDLVKTLLEYLGIKVDYNFKFKVRTERTASCSIRHDGYLKDFGSENISGFLVNFLIKIYNFKFLETFNYLKTCFGIRHEITANTAKLPNPSGFLKSIERR